MLHDIGEHQNVPNIQVSHFYQPTYVCQNEHVNFFKQIITRNEKWILYNINTSIRQ